MSKLCDDCGTVPLRYNNRSGFCKDCYDRNRPRNKKGTVEHTEYSQRNREYYLKNLERERGRARTWRFGISIKEYNEMRALQNYKCKICHRHENEIGTLNVDHDHSCCKTSRGQKTCGQCIRGLLCRECNHGLGNFMDDIDRMRSAIKYIEEYGNYSPVSEQQVIDLIRVAEDIT